MHGSLEEDQVSSTEENSVFQDGYSLGQWFSALLSESSGKHVETAEHFAWLKTVIKYDYASVTASDPLIVDDDKM